MIQLLTHTLLPLFLVPAPASAFSLNWGLKQSQSVEAQKLIKENSTVEKPEKKIIVAVIDTGIDTEHPALKNSLWTNTGETGPDSQGRDKSSNGIDDDNNGFIDDVHGWNFANNNNNLIDQHGHGTHIAGIIGSQNSMTGVNPDVSLMTLKYYDAKTGFSNLQNTIRAIHYAIQMKADIINYSGGGLEKSPEEEAAIRLAADKGILFVAAAGNESSDSDVKAFYPADYKLPNIISVTALNERSQILESSNYGVHSVDIAAPGSEIFSTLPGGNYGFMTGTSQATAFVSGAAALYMSQYKKTFGSHQLVSMVKQALTENGDYNENLVGKVRTQNRLNIYKAMVMKASSESALGQNTGNLSQMNESFFSSAFLIDDENLSRSIAQLNRP